MRSKASQALTVLVVGLAVYVVFLLAQYFLPPHAPRFRVETFFMWLLAIGTIAIVVRPMSSGDSAQELPPRFEAWQFLALAVVFLLIVLLQYGAALGVGFLSDDFVIAGWATRREWIHAAETGFVRPVVPMAWGLLSFLPFDWAATLHAVNLLLHALNGLLIVALGAKLGMHRTDLAAAGLVFATLSAMSEAVVWISGMQDVLMTTLAVTAVLGVVSSGISPGVSLGGIAAVVSGALALGVKETAVVIPVLAWMAAWASPEGVGRGQRRRTLLTMTTVVAAYVAARVAAGVPSSYAQGISRYFVKQLLVEPFANLGAPWSAAWLQAHPWAGLARAAVIVSVLAAAMVMWRRRDAAFSRAIVCAGWVVVSVLPVFSFFHVSATLEGSRYLYLPAAGFALLVALLLGEAARSMPRRFTPVLIAAGVMVLAIQSVTASRFEVARWTEAAALRDRILTDYVRVMPSGSCGAIAAEGVVDNVDGAYVLRNGFAQALAEMGAEASESAAPRCRVSWTDHLVVTQEP